VTIKPAEVHEILVVRQHNQLGDMLCVTPLLRALKLRFPAARITLLTSPVNNAVMLHHRLLDRVVNYDKKLFLRGSLPRLGALGAFIKGLRAPHIDLAIVPATVSMSLTSDILAYVSGARWRIGAGSLEGKKNPGAILYTDPVALSWDRDRGRHQTLRNIDICTTLTLPLPELSLEMTLLPEELAEGLSEVLPLRAGARGVVAFHPGAGKPPNRWPTDSFARVISDLQNNDGYSTIVIRGPMDDVPVNDLLRSLSVSVHLVENKSIRQVASILKSVDLLVSNDTGVMHVGAAVGVPVLSLFGPTDPRQWAPPGTQNRYIRCESGVMSDITVGSVLDAAREMLREHEAELR
jgi:ADP-heptose:LPS heptosyltransferase